MEEEKDTTKGFRVIDRRNSGQKEKIEGEATKEKGPFQEKKERAEEASPVPEITFSSFVYSLSTSVLIHLGEIPEPITQKTTKNLSLAKQTIDILVILQEKTTRNLTQEEENLLSSLLYDLRMRYVRAIS